ncbi:hypothetical protein INT48_005101 [Thamnidium elegans]|uniref:Myb-like domain-containing protein n=1 Tax=Thamnidium elegans TaxID=101142 RepID=A0A8H7STG6_9FUNG|nr:hypothetical protein INT48_005101 [Thamnidium elegans]
MSNHFTDYETGAVEGLLKLQQPTDHYLTLSPIHPLQQETHHRLPSLSNLLLPSHQDQQLYSLSDDTASIYSSNTQQASLIPPLSTSTSFSSLRSCTSSTKSKSNLLTRAATFTGRRRGRPRKPTEIKIVDMSCYYQTDHSTESVTPSSNKPRWQETERLELLEAIVKEKELDDMTTIRWDRISLAVGRAKKACKDQWRRELLPNIMKGLRPSSKKNNVP